MAHQTEVKAVTCSVESCDNKSYVSGGRTRGITRGLCDMHYQRWRKSGDPNIVNRIVDGRQKHPLHKTYRKMKERFFSVSCPEYPRYGGRGITISDVWLDDKDGFWSFVKDMGERQKGTSLDRIDNDGNYEPSNCRWATIWEQNSNTRRNNETVGLHYIANKKLWHASLQYKNVVYQRCFKEKVDAINYRERLVARFLGGVS